MLILFSVCWGATDGFAVGEVGEVGEWFMEST